VPKAEQLDEWQTAVENLINAAEVGGGWLMLARIGIMKALNRHVDRMFNPSRKDKHWRRRRKLAGSMTKADSYRHFRLPWRTKLACKPCRN
jgi:hypothetical protein